MKSINGGRRGPPPPQQQDGIAVRPIGDVGDPKRAVLAAKLLADMVGIMQRQTGARPTAGLLAFTFPDGSMTFLVAANTADQAAEVMGPVYQQLHMLNTTPPPPSGTNVTEPPTGALTEPSPPPLDADDTGRSLPAVAVDSDETSDGPESSDP